MPRAHLALLALLTLIACDEGHRHPHNAPHVHTADIEPQDQIDALPLDEEDPPPVYPRLVINELQCRDGEWIELFNPGDEPTSLAGWSLTDRLSDPSRAFILPDVQLAPESWIVLDHQTADADGFTFGISCNGDETLYLLDPNGAISDRLSLVPIPQGLTQGRLPDGENPVNPLLRPTPAEANAASDDARIVINEVQCRGGAGEWIELASAEDHAVSLAGWALTDRGDEARLVFDDDAVIAPGEHLVVHEQTRTTDGFTFRIGCSDDRLRLHRPGGAIADEVTLLPHPDWLTLGRLPDLDGALQPSAPTPGAVNALPIDEPSASLFDPTRGVLTIDLDLGPDARAQLEAAPYLYVPATFTLTEPDGTMSPALEAEIRIKGRLGSFRPMPDGKSAFKVRFDTPFRGLNKLTLNNMVQDRSAIHEWLAYTLFREMGVPAPRVGYAWVRVNNLDYGLYTHIETLDEVALSRHFDTTAHLYEGEYGQDLTFNHLTELDVDVGPSSVRSDLAALITALDTYGSTPEFYTALDPFLDWPEILAMMATELAIGHWDGYAPYLNNYFAHADEDGRFSLLPWGTDQTFDRLLSFDIQHNRPGRLLVLCLEHPQCRTDFYATLSQIYDVFLAHDFPAEVTALVTLIEPWLESDPRREGSMDAHRSAVASTLAFLEARTTELDELTACLRAPNPDADGDGFACDVDCRPDDPNTFPGANEICNDGIDNDCSGFIDDDPSCPECALTQMGPHTYYICKEPRSYDAGRLQCQSLGAEPILINTAAENRWAWRAAVERSGERFLIGLTDRVTEGTFLWWNASVPTFTAWNTNEPNDYGTGEDCTEFWPGNQPLWNDTLCDRPVGMICETVCPLGQDDDNDGALRCGDDCDDGDPDTYAGAPEICGDGIDQDCDGIPDNGCP